MRVRELTRALAQYGGVAVLVMLCAHTALGATSDYYYFNCYADQLSSPDLKGEKITYPTFDLDTCAADCANFGHPYFGIQKQQLCYCGDDFGQYGTSNTCNYTCNTNVKCGGVSANDIYYSVKIDATTKAARETVVYTEGMTFANARGQCLQNNGDLVTIPSAPKLTMIQDILSSKGITSGKMWQGIWKHDGSYKWVDPTEAGGITTSNTFWKTGETHANPCVALDIETGKWETTSCLNQFPFLCDQDPPMTGDTTDAPEDTTGDAAEEDSGFDTSELSLYIVLPLFGLCYGGSCVLYCSHKIYKSFKRKKRQKMLLSRLEDMPESQTEYEPHNKPKYEPAKPGSGHGRPFSASKRATVYPVVGPPPVSNYNNKKDERLVKTPVENINIPSPGGDPEDDEPQPGPSPDRPDTTRDVTLTMDNTDPPTRSPTMSPPPAVVSTNAVATAAVAIDAMKNQPKRSGVSSAKTKTELRREKLLKKALKEARQRRRDEGTPVPGDSTLPQAPPAENQWAAPASRRKPYDDNDSGDSTVNLLSDNDRSRSSDMMGRDPTTMSIQEILRMKVSMRQTNRRRPKKIITA